jgi:two-component system, NtrC family, sensor kinase
MPATDLTCDTLRALVNSIPFAIYVVDANYILVTANTMLFQRVEQPPQALAGQVCYQILYEHETPCPGCLVHETLQEGKTTTRTRRSRNSNQEAQLWEVGSYPLRDGDGNVCQAVLLEQDVTERHRLESLVAQSEQLAAIGQLAAGVAHEINNPLTAILANAQLLHREIPPDDDKQELVEMISEAGSRAAHVVRSLLDLARLEQYEFLPSNVNESIRKAIELVRHEIISKSIQLNTELSSTLPLIRASQSHLQGVWVNLLLNATDAFEQGSGEIRVTSSLVENEVQIIITDNGKGIAPEQLPHIFDPFYTTKSAGHGTGLGLSVCDRVVKRHNGRIQIKSEVGKGTEITVTLPIT